MTSRLPARPGWARHFAVFALTLGAGLGLARTAEAQSITIAQGQSLPRVSKDGKDITKRAQNLTPEGVSYQDCLDDQRIRFSLIMSGFEVNANVEVWASVGGDCSALTTRQGGTQVCWRVYDSSVPLQQNAIIEVPVRNILSGAPPFSALNAAENRTEKACGQVNLTNINVQFLYFPPANPSTATAPANATIQVDTVGPKPPSGLRALPGNTRIGVQWNSISGGSADGGSGTSGGGLTELTGLKVYCDVAGSTASTTEEEAGVECRDEPVDAGPDADAGEDAGTIRVCDDAGTTSSGSSSSSDCASGNFTSESGPVIPSAAFNAKYECGSVAGNTGTSIVASQVGGKPLVNGTRYAVAVAATDRFGNVGELSAVVCEVPEETTDFWDEYRAAGGHAGDGCTVGGDASVGSVAALGFGVTAALSALFRGRRRMQQGARR